MMNEAIKQQDVNNAAWAACDTFRGVMDAAGHKDYILVMLFLKYISDVWKDHYEEYRKQYGDDDVRIRRKLERERFILPKDAGFYDLYKKRIVLCTSKSYCACPNPPSARRRNSLELG